MTREFERILLTRLKYIGDIVLTTPLIHTLRDRFPAIRQRNQGAPDVLDVDIGEDLRLRTNALPIAQGVIGVAFDQPLVGQHRAGVDVDADERAAADGAQRQRGAGVVAQDVEADGEVHGLADGAAGGGHGGDGLGGDAALGEGHIAEVLDEEGVGAAALVGAGVVHGELDHGFHIAPPARRAGQGLEVDDADEESWRCADKSDFMSLSLLLLRAALPGRPEAASLSAAFLLLPWPRASSAPPWCTVHSNMRSWSGPVAETT